MKIIRRIVVLSTCLVCLALASDAQTNSKKEKQKKGKSYKVVSKSGNVNNVQVAKKGGTSGEIKVIVVRMNKPVSVTNLEIKTANGNFYTEKFTATDFPVQATMSFQAPSATGFGSSMEQFSCKVTLSENGIWEIRINLANV